jgi:hypothetical protein|tara:strand:+ start:3547 stop:4212 length:666 start_codon:yes stop_codon:yes gene_type:complete
MILATTAINKPYTESAEKLLKVLDRKIYDIRVLTDDPERFKEYGTTTYSNIIFSYYDKLTYAFQLALKEKQGVLFVDANKIHAMTPDFHQHFKGSDDYCFVGYWDYGNSIWKDTDINGSYWDKLTDYLKLADFPINLLRPLLETVFYIPYDNRLRNVTKYIEVLKPIIEYNSMFEKSIYNHRGNGEGMGIAFSLLLNNIKPKFFTKKQIYELDPENKSILR